MWDARGGAKPSTGAAMVHHGAAAAASAATESAAGAADAWAGQLVGGTTPGAGSAPPGGLCELTWPEDGGRTKVKEAGDHAWKVAGSCR